MTFEAFKVFIRPLAVHFGAVKDEPTWRLYFAGLTQDPAPSDKVLALAARRCIGTRGKFPTVPEFRADAEAERQALLKAHPYVKCEACRGANGFVPVRGDDGVVRVKRCPCFAAYQASIATLEIGERVLALPPAAEEFV
jgi:hypothetical protein